MGEWDDPSANPEQMATTSKIRPAKPLQVKRERGDWSGDDPCGDWADD